MIRLFIAGTDTDVGKTYISTQLLQAAQQKKLRTLGIKPVASGSNAAGYNDDALQLQGASTVSLPYAAINPFSFQPAIAPHIAANHVHCDLSVATLHAKLQTALHTATDFLLIEGFGGWYAPLNLKETMADFVIQQNLPVLLIVGIRLGCLNHAILTTRALQQQNVKLIGWIANCLSENLPACQENITTLRAWLPAPCLDVVEYRGKVQQALDGIV